MHRRYVFAGLLAALPLAAAAQPTGQPAATPQAFLEALYHPYRQKGFQGQPYTEVDRFFEPELASAIRRDMDEASRRKEVPLLDGDPFIDAQEWEVTSLSIVSSVSGTVAAGAVAFVNYGRPKALAVMLVQTPQGWRISDITGSAGSFRALYKLR